MLQTRVYNLWVHDERFSKHDIVINPDIFPALRPGNLIHISHPHTLQQQRALTVPAAPLDSRNGQAARGQQMQSNNMDLPLGNNGQQGGVSTGTTGRKPTLNNANVSKATDSNSSLHGSSSLSDIQPSLSLLSPASMDTGKQQHQQQESIDVNYEYSDSQKLVLQLPEPDTASKGNQLQVSIANHLAVLFNLQPRTDVAVQQIDPASISADYVELTYRDQSISRSDMWRFKGFVTNTCVYVTKKIVYLGIMRVQVKDIFIGGKRSACGYISEDTKIVFRSESSKMYIFIQMSKEMWDFDDVGDLYFEKAVHSFLPELFSRWKRINANHVVSIILFSRVLFLPSEIGISPYSADRGVQGSTSNSGDSKGTIGDGSSDHLIYSRTGAIYKDYYKVVVDLETRNDWTSVLTTLKREFVVYQRDVLQHNVNGVVMIRGRLAPASQGNVLEAMNLALNPYDRHHVDRDLHLMRAGLSVVVVTPGTGIIETDKHLLRLTTQRMLDNGFGLDLVCLGKPPLHTTPLFEYHSKFSAHGEPIPASPIDAERRAKVGMDKAKDKLVETWDPLYYDDTITTNVEYVFYTVPDWVDCSYYAPPTDTDSTFPTQFVPRCKMYEAQMNGINHPEAIYGVPLLEDSAERACIANPDQYTIACNLYDDLVIYNPSLCQKDQSWANSTLLTTTTRSMATAAADLPSIGKQWSGALNQMPACDVSAELSPISVNRSHHSIEEVLSVSQGYQIHHIRSQSHQGSPERQQISDALSSSYTAIHRVGSDASMASKWRERTENFIGVSGTDDERGGAGSGCGEFRGILSASPTAGLAYNRMSTRKSDRLATTYSSRHTGNSHSKSISQNKESYDSVTYSKHSPSGAGNSHQPLQTVNSTSRRDDHSGTIADPSSRPISISLHRQTNDQPPLRNSYADSHRMSDRQTWRNSNSRITLSNNQQQKYQEQQQRLLRINLICPWNPSKNTVRINSHLQRWPHLHPRVSGAVLNIAAPKWNSLCTPAALPLTTDSFPTQDELLELYQEYTYTVSVNEDYSAGGDGPNVMRTDDLLTELISLRLMQGFQIIVPSNKGQQVSEADGPALSTNFRTLHRGYGSHKFLSMGHHVHKLMYDPSGQNVEVKRYVRKLDYSTDPIAYKCYIWPKQQEFYQPLQIKFQYPILSAFNWNYVDHMVSGYLDEMDSSRLYRAAFALIPVEMAPQSVNSSTEQLNEEELRIAGFHKFVECFQKAKWMQDADRVLLKEMDKKLLYHLNNVLHITHTTFTRSGHVKNEQLKSTTMAPDDERYGETEFESTNIGLLHARRGSGPVLNLTKSSKFNTIAAAMQNPQYGVRFRDRRWHLLLYEKTFIGTEAVDWMIKMFSDIDSREDAVQFGKGLLSKGFFVHVNQRHQFLDGHYFYRLKSEYYNNNTKSESEEKPNLRWFRSRSNTSDIDAKEYPGKDEADALSAEKMSKSAELSLRRKVVMSRKLMIDLDTGHKSDHKEVHWINCTLRLLEDVILSWSRVAERNGLRLVETPLDQARLLTNDNPFYSPSIINLAVPPPTRRQLQDFADATQLPSFYFEVELLKAFGFVLDDEADYRFPNGTASYSYLRPVCKYNQYIHRSGTLFMLLCGEDKGFLCFTNPFTHGHAFSSHSKIDRSPSSGVNLIQSTVSTTQSADAAQSVSEVLRRTFDKSHNIVADVLRRAFQDFCADTLQLTKLWNELLHSYDPNVLHETADNLGDYIVRAPAHFMTDQSFTMPMEGGVNSLGGFSTTREVCALIAETIEQSDREDTQSLQK